MNEAKHTPGPYRLDYETDDSRPCRLYVRAGTRTLIASTEDNPEAIAQFALFAAAPELLDALKFIGKLWDDQLPTSTLVMNFYEAKVAAYIAIAKAEGKAQEITL